MASVKEHCLGGDERSKVKTVHVKTGPLQVRRGGCRVVWRSRVARMKSLGSERREKCGRRHDGISCRVDEPVFTCKVSLKIPPTPSG